MTKQWRGGARIGLANATWPFACLSASAELLTLEVGFFGTFSFSPTQVTAIEPHFSLPLIGRGVRIRHSIAAYPDPLIFWCFVRPEGIVSELNRLGYGQPS
jgi:hypothetical protein